MLSKPFIKPGIHKGKKKPILNFTVTEIFKLMNKKPRALAQEIEVSQERCNEGVNKWLKAPPPPRPPKLTNLEGDPRGPHGTTCPALTN